jgi:hypothetical protein
MRLVSRLNSTGLNGSTTQEGLATAENRCWSRRNPAFDLAGADLGDVGGIDRIGVVGGARIEREPSNAPRAANRGELCALQPIPMGNVLAESAAST